MRSLYDTAGLKRSAVTWIIIVMCMVIPAEGTSCPVPVFRYALEFWEADPYIVEIHYIPPLESFNQELVNLLINSSREGERKSNLEVRIIKTEGNSAATQSSVRSDISTADYPLMVLKYPRISGINGVIWSGSLTRENISLVTDSPVRSAIAGKLAAGTTAVWVLLESGNRRKDRDAYDLLNRHLRRLEQTLVMPDPDMWLARTRQGTNEEFPVVSFEAVIISRDDPREEYTIRMLMGTEDDLKEFESEPVVFPVYGRGIALWAIVGRGINEWNISEAAEFLTGPCSCQAKLLNPGVDLLMAMDWDSAVENIADISLSNPLSGMSDFGNRETEVKRLLEAATIERFGPGRRQSGNPENSTAKVVYLDIFQKSEHDSDQATDNPGEIMNAEVFIKSYLPDEISASDLSDVRVSEGGESIPPDSVERDASEILPSSGQDEQFTGERRILPDSELRGRGLMSGTAMVFGGIIFSVFAVGLVLYWKRIK